MLQLRNNLLRTKLSHRSMQNMRLDAATYCHYCGCCYPNKLWPRRCICCDNLTFNNPVPIGVGILPIIGDDGFKLLLTRRRTKPHIGELCFPGGFINWDETWQQSISQKIREETMIETRPDEFQLFDVRSTPDCSKIIIFALSSVVRDVDSVRQTDPVNETRGLVLGSRDTQLCFESHQDVYDKLAINLDRHIIC